MKAAKAASVVNTTAIRSTRWDSLWMMQKKTEEKWIWDHVVKFLWGEESKSTAICLFFPPFQYVLLNSTPLFHLLFRVRIIPPLGKLDSHVFLESNSENQLQKEIDQLIQVFLSEGKSFNRLKHGNECAKLVKELLHLAWLGGGLFKIDFFLLIFCSVSCTDK